ncbi:MAG: hypothetical protein ABFS17_01890 [Chloroflexota bacterium]
MAKKITLLDRVLLLVTGVLAAYQVGFGIRSLGFIPEISYAVAFGVLLIAGLLIIILGFEILDSPMVVVVATIIPLSMSLGLVAQFYQSWLGPFAVFVALSFLVILITRFVGGKGIKVIAIIIGHGISGMIIFLVPLLLSFSGKTPGLFSFVGVGGALIGIGGSLLSFLKMGKPILSKNTILTILPGLLMIMMICFLVGFSALAN